MKKIAVLIIIVAFIVINISYVYANENALETQIEINSQNINRGKFAIGLNYPGIGLRYSPTKKYTIEIKGQLDEQITAYGLRVYRYFDTILFVGLEAGYITYDLMWSNGTGSVGELFLGGEYFFQKNLSFQMDFGPAWINLKDIETGIVVEGIEYVANFGVNWYIGDTNK